MGLSYYLLLCVAINALKITILKYKIQAECEYKQQLTSVFTNSEPPYRHYLHLKSKSDKKDNTSRQC